MESTRLSYGKDHRHNRHDRGHAMEVMNRGAAVVVKKLYGKLKFDGIISMGGGGGTGVAASPLRALPVGIPELLVSTVASGDISPYVVDLLTTPYVFNEDKAIGTTMRIAQL